MSERTNGASPDDTDDDGPKPGEMRVLATDNGDTSVGGAERLEDNKS